MFLKRQSLFYFKRCWEILSIPRAETALTRRYSDVRILNCRSDVTYSQKRKTPNNDKFQQYKYDSELGLLEPHLEDRYGQESGARFTMKHLKPKIFVSTIQILYMYM